MVTNERIYVIDRYIEFQDERISFATETYQVVIYLNDELTTLVAGFSWSKSVTLYYDALEVRVHINYLWQLNLYDNIIFLLLQIELIQVVHILKGNRFLEEGPNVEFWENDIFAAIQSSIGFLHIRAFFTNAFGVQKFVGCVADPLLNLKIMEFRDQGGRSIRGGNGYIWEQLRAVCLVRGSQNHKPFFDLES